MTEAEALEYSRGLMEKAGGPLFHPFRDHETKYGWGVIHIKTGAIFALVGAKGCAFGLAAALNGNWDAAKAFMDTDIPDEYFERFL